MKCKKWGDCAEYTPRKCHGEYACGNYDDGETTENRVRVPPNERSDGK